MRRLAAGLGALILSVILLAGLPTALVLLAGNPVPSWDRLVTAFTTPDYGGEFLIGTVLPVLAWVAWATFAIGYLAEIPNHLRSRQRRGHTRVRVPGLGMQQKAAGVLIAAMIAVFAPASAFAADAPVATAPTVKATVAAAAPAPSQAVASQDPGTDEKTQAPTYIVQPGDSLWAIAEAATGDGNRWQEVYALNQDRPQPGGYTVGERDGIDPGMVLELPAGTEAPESATAAVGEQNRVIVTGDTLWDIAAEELGAGDRYPEIFDASRDIVQPDGRRLTDPNLILPGWTVDIPSPDTASASTPDLPAPPVASDSDAEAAVPAPLQGSGTGEAAGGDSGLEGTSGLGFVTDAAGEADSSSAEAVAPKVDEMDAETAGDTDWVDIASDWRTLGGIGGLLAAGLLGLLAWRRRQQRRNRKPGQRIAMPVGDISDVELELRAVEQPQGMEAVDHALRLLALWSQDTGQRLPTLYALRLSQDEVSVFLDEAAQLPEPFTAVSDDHMAWSVPFDKLETLERIPSPPYPALVTLGHDANDAHLLVDLERLGALNVEGTPAQETAALTALALELATSTWAENLQITLVGVAPELPDAIGTGRIRFVDDIPRLMHDLHRQADAVGRALEEAGIGSLEEARSAGPLAESWTPEIIILGQMPDDGTRAELAELVSRVPRVGVAAIAAGHLAGDWNFRIHDDDSAELTIPGTSDATLPLTPQLVSPDDYERVLRLFTVTNEAAVDGTGAPAAELVLDEIAAEQPEPSGTVADDRARDDIAASEADEADVSVGIDPTPAQVPSSEPPSEVSEQVAPVVNLHIPRLQLLGPVTVMNPQGVEPANLQQWNSQRLRAIELVAYIGTHRRASTEQVHDALWPGSDPAKGTGSRNRLTTAARRWLGSDVDGNPYLVHATTGVYDVTDTLTSDWNEWLALVGSDPAGASTENLVRALALVKGQPISGVKEKYYVWAETLRQEMIAAIGDAAHELATRALREGNTRNARMAAAIGRMVDPINEIFWRDALRAEHMAGDTAGVERLVTQLETALTQVDPDYAEPEPETEELIRQLRRRHAHAG